MLLHLPFLLMRFVSDLLFGLSAPKRGVRVLRTYPQLVPYALAPSTITVLIVVGAIYLSWRRLSAILWWCFRKLPDHQEEFLLDFIRPSAEASWFRRHIIENLADAFVFFAKFFTLAGVAFLALLLAMIVCAFLWEILAEKVMNAVHPSQEDHKSNSLSSFTRSVVLEFFKALILIFVPLVIWMFSFVPVIGAPVSLVLSSIVGTILYGFSLVDYPMSVREASLGERWKWVKSSLFFLLGIGVYFYLPIINGLLFPFLVVASAEKYAQSSLSGAP